MKAAIGRQPKTAMGRRREKSTYVLRVTWINSSVMLRQSFATGEEGIQVSLVAASLQGRSYHSW